MILHSPFSLSFYKFSIPDWQNCKNKLLDLVDWDNRECWSGDHFSDYYDGNDKKKYTLDFVDIVKDSFEALGKELEAPLFLSSLWAQRYFTNNFMQPHNHGALGYSFVLYVEFNKSQHPSTTFYSPFNCPIRGDVIEYKPDISEGDIFFFPSTLLHMAEPNKSTLQRTIFSGNIKAQV